jgi:hypothetical protein
MLGHLIGRGTRTAAAAGSAGAGGAAEAAEAADGARPGAGRRGGRGRLAVIGLFLAVLVIHAASPVVQSGDSRLSVPTALRLVEHGDLRLDDDPLVRDHPDRTDVVTGRDGHRYWAFPWVSALFAVPAVAALRTAGVNVPALAEGSHSWVVEKPVAALLTALTTLLLLSCVRAPAPRRRRPAVPLPRAGSPSIPDRIASGPDPITLRAAVLLAVVFAFGTSVWSTAGLALWTHGPSMLFLTIALRAALRLAAGTTTRAAHRHAAVLGAALAMAYTVRPAGALALAGFTGWLAVRDPRRLPSAAAGAGAVLAAFCTVNLAAFGTLLPPYFSAGRLHWTAGTVAAMAGSLISPSRGLLVFTPVVLAAVAGVRAAVRGHAFTGLHAVACLVVVGQWLVIALFPHWWGGAAYGPRLFTDVLPLLAWLAVPAVRTWAATAARLRSRQPRTPDGQVARPAAREGAILVGVVVLCVVSGAVTAQGALLRSSWCWNRVPVHVDIRPARVWDWTDPQFLRGARVLAGQGVRTALWQRCLDDRPGPASPRDDRDSGQPRVAARAMAGSP